MTDLGRDISCTTSMKTGRFSTGPRLVAEACFRRLTTPRGMLRGGEAERNYGKDLSELIGSVAPKLAAASLPGQIKTELLKDERLESVAIVVKMVTEGPKVSFQIDIVGETAEGPFTLVLLASAVTIELLGIKVDS